MENDFYVTQNALFVIKIFKIFVVVLFIQDFKRKLENGKL